MPIDLINGLEDPIPRRSIVARWRELLPSAPLFELSHLWHYPQVEAPNEVLAAYRDFIAQVGPFGR